MKTKGVMKLRRMKLKIIKRVEKRKHEYIMKRFHVLRSQKITKNQKQEIILPSKNDVLSLKIDIKRMVFNLITQPDHI